MHKCEAPLVENEKDPRARLIRIRLGVYLFPRNDIAGIKADWFCPNNENSRQHRSLSFLSPFLVDVIVVLSVQCREIRSHCTVLLYWDHSIFSEATDTRGLQLLTSLDPPQTIIQQYNRPAEKRIVLLSLGEGLRSKIRFSLKNFHYILPLYSLLVFYSFILFRFIFPSTFSSHHSICHDSCDFVFEFFLSFNRSWNKKLVVKKNLLDI